MAEELGKINRPEAEDFRKGRKLFFVPLLLQGIESPADFLEKFNRYWEQVESQLSNLELKLGQVVRIYHELIPADGEKGAEAVKSLSEKSHKIVKARMDWGAKLEMLESAEALTEFMDWSRCLSIGLQNEKVINRVYEFYIEAGKKRDKYLSQHIDETLKADEIGLVFMREGHRVQFPTDVQVFYVAPPALDDIKRWLRDTEARLRQEHQAHDHDHPDAVENK